MTFPRHRLVIILKVFLSREDRKQLIFLKPRHSWSAKGGYSRKKARLRADLSKIFVLTWSLTPKSGSEKKFN